MRSWKTEVQWWREFLAIDHYGEALRAWVRYHFGRRPQSNANEIESQGEDESPRPAA